MYFGEHLHAIHRKDLFVEGLEAIWLQVKTSSTLALFSVIYRPPDDNLFFERIKAWLRSGNIFCSAILIVTFLFKEIQMTYCTETQLNCVLSLNRLIYIT